MSLRRVVEAIIASDLVVSGLAACGSGPAPEASLHSSLAAFSTPQSWGFTALEVGRLRLVDGCFEVGEATLWPYGFHVGALGRSIVSPDGHIFSLGERLSLGGGDVPIVGKDQFAKRQPCLKGARSVWAASSVTGLGNP